MQQYVYGVDVGGTTIKIGHFTAQGKLEERWEIPTRTAQRGAALLSDIAAALLGDAEHCNIADSVIGIGLGVPGAVQENDFVAPCVNLDQWGGFRAATALEKLCPWPVYAVNDANAAALGEMWQGGARGRQNVVFVTLGTGVGGGILVDGRLLTGSHGAGGEIGHIKVRTGEKRACGCGKHGCLEQYASATGIVATAKMRLAAENPETGLRNVPEITSREIFRMAEAGDKFCRELVAGLADDLGKALASASCVCDPEIIVIGGGVSKAGEFLLSQIRLRYRAYAFPAAENVEFALASLGNDAGIYGGARLALTKA